ncbi:DUF7287 family protein [Natronosalvus vescus]|uniref:DUF7287 family protein n=1 Tax=Natronosalvus vescus TaxID=2953881 RepID=UPI0020908345|nr:hypothetical protein [Natronosalvus vescus]
MSKRRPHTNTVSISLADRGQTTQDFAVGIGIFLLAVAFVFSFVPTLITPFATSTASETAQADRIADEIVANYSEEPNQLDLTALESANVSELGVRAVDDHQIDRVNITVVNTSDGGGTFAHPEDSPYTDESAGSATRLVTVTEDADIECDRGCKLIVRVW